MQSKSLLIAIAAFAVTATGAQAYVGTKYLAQSGLSTQQVEAFQQARELRRKGEAEKARDLLLGAGINEDVIVSLRKAARGSHNDIHNAVESGNFAAFREAIEGTPLADIVTTEDDFTLFSKAHDLKLEGKFVEAKGIFEELGVKEFGMLGRHGGNKNHENFLDLSAEQRDALRAARQANDHETVEAILKEAGITNPQVENKMGKHHWR